MVNTSGNSHPPSHTRGLVGECQETENQSTVAVDNLPFQLDKFFTVHQCAEENEIPFAFVKAGGQTTFPYSISRYNLKAPLDKPFNYRAEFPVDDSETYSTQASNLCMTPQLGLVDNPPSG